MAEPIPGRWMAAAAFIWAVAGAVVSPGAEATIETTARILDGRSGRAVGLGGLSDLVPAADGSGWLWTTTDRGPNGTATSNGKTVRTLLAPAFTPEILGIELSPAPAGGAARIVKSLPLAGRSGKPLSGRPNGVGRDEPILDADRGTPLPPDPNGVDTEGIVQMPDGTFWMVEEYRPSLLHVGANGRLLARHVPQGTRLEGADSEIRDTLPAVYGARRDNRGFESIAASPDGRRLWAMLQSPLENGKPRRVGKAGNVRLLAFDPAAGRPAAEHVYRLGDPAAPDYLTKGCAPDDGKICAVTTIAGESLLVIEQDDTGLARLYRADLADATDTLPRQLAATEPPLEELRDLIAAGIVPVRKTLVADLAPLVAAMRRDVYGEVPAATKAALKLEGLAILGADRVALVNDNDFGVQVPPGARCDTCLWVIRLSHPLDPGDHASSR